MAVDLDSPYEDEILFSVVARYLSDLRVDRKAAVLVPLFGRVRRIPIALATNLDRCSLETAHTWGWSAREIADQLTLFPYFASFMSSEHAERVHKLTVGHPGPLGGSEPAFVSGFSRSFKQVRYCGECCAADRAAGRAMYWRRSHQLPGVLVCHVHNRWLDEVQLQGRSRAASWMTVEDCLDNAQNVPLRLDPVQREACFQVARMSQWLLSVKVRVLDEEMLRAARYIAKKGGYCLNARALNIQALIGEFTDFFGEQYLSYVRALPVGGKQSWLARAFQGRLCAQWTLKRVLFSAFFAALDKSACTEGWPSCPDSSAAHGPGHPVEERIWRRASGHYSARCICGLAFSYSAVRDGHPQNVRITHYGWRYVEFAHRLRDSGASVRTIAKVLNVANSTVCRMLAPTREPAGEPRSDAERKAMIARWRRHCQKWGGRRMIPKAKGLYRMMCRYAPDEL
jgi:hypothetical protein